MTDFHCVLQTSFSTRIPVSLLDSPICLDQPAEEMTAVADWCAEWSATDVLNHCLVAVPYLSGLMAKIFDHLPRREWAMLNRFRTAWQGCCAANLVRWKHSADPRHPRCTCRQS